MATPNIPKAKLVEFMRYRLQTNPKWVIAGLVAIYNQQTADEQSVEHTRHRNYVGFNGVDAKILTSMAKQVIRTKRLTEKQYALVERKMLKYAKQLVILSNPEKLAEYYYGNPKPLNSTLR